MPPVEPFTLAAAIDASGLAGPAVHDAADFIEDSTGRLAILSLAAGAGAAEPMRGKSVLLAIPAQRETIAALVQLDGVARRVILWPPDRPAAQIGMVMDRAGVDATLTAWPPDREHAKFGQAKAGQADLPQAHSVRARAAAAMASPDKPTEWILFTSGTTGQPKMIVHTLHSLAGHIRPAAFGPAPYGQRPIWASFYDARRYGGLQIALRALVGGGSLVLSDDRETMAAFLARARAAGVTHCLGTPSHWRLALMSGVQSLRSLTYVRLSGEVADQTILDSLSKTFPAASLVHAFASTEAGLAFEVTDRRAGFPSSLVADPGRGPQLRIVDGMLHVRSERAALGKLQTAITPIADAEGFVETGDAVALSGGRYTYAGRRDGMVNVGGQKVFPEEIEAVINRHPAVHMSRVSARRNAITGALVSAEIVRRATDLPGDPAALPRDVIEFCREFLPPHKIPVSVKLVPALEVAPSGKLVRLRA